MEMAPSPRTVEEIFKDYSGRRAGLVRALTYDVDEFYGLCDPGKENLCLYGHPNESWEVILPAEKLPPELPEPALGINFARDGTNRRDWLSLVAVHSDSWLLSVAFYHGARLNRNERKRLFSLMNDLPTVFEVVTERKPVKDKPAEDSGSKSRVNAKEYRKITNQTVPNLNETMVCQPLKKSKQERNGGVHFAAISQNSKTTPSRYLSPFWTMEDAETPPSNSVNLSRKIIAVSAGEAHTLALTGDGRVFSWGRGTFGRLGTGKEADELFPVPVEFSSGELLENKLKIEGIATGSYHSLALADDGSVWCWGYNGYGQLGIDGENSLVPRCLDPFLVSFKDGSERKSKETLKICSVKAGGMMSFAIDIHGTLWTWGRCRPQQSSSPGDDGLSLVSISTPIPVFGFHGRTVVKVACGSEHIVALVSAKELYEGDDNLICYSWGSNCHGQLGLGDKENRSHPQIIKTLDHDSSWVVYEVACGASHSAVLTHKKGPIDLSDSQCWTFGLGDNGQLGHGTTQSLLIPESVKELPKHIFFISIDCGLFHTSVVSITGDVWSWGMEKGLGLCPNASFTGTDTGDVITPILISYNGLNEPKFMEPVQIVCGAAHTVLVSDNGFKLWSWGRGGSGVLGNGNTVDCFAPTLALWPLLSEDFEEERKKIESKDFKGDTEMEKKLSLAMEEMTILRSKLSMMENYASILHGSIFGKPFQEQDVPSSMGFDIAKEWENMLESADHPKLARMEMSYRNMLAGVKDKIMKKRIKELVKECLQSETTSN